MPTMTRTVALFVMHARIREEVIDYENFLRWISTLSPRESRIEVRPDLTFVVDLSFERDGYFALTFISGDPTEVPLFFNEGTGEVEEGSEARERWPARQTRVIMDPRSRLVGIESRRAGVGARNLERYFQLLARDRGYAPDMIFDLAMQPSESFEEELDRYGRIREASVVIKRPNTDWEDAEDAVADLADASDGHSAAVTVNAGRGNSLSKSSGLLAVIRSQIQRPRSSVSNVRVTGTKVGESKETTLSLSRHQVKKPIDIPSRATGTQERDRVIDDTISLIVETAARIFGTPKNPDDERS